MAETIPTYKRKSPFTSIINDGTAPSSHIPAKPRTKKSRAIECPICLEPTKPKQLITLETCGCKYCKSCLNEALTVGLLNTTYPARCCGRPLELLVWEKYVDRKVARAYRRKGEEMRADSPVYCANALCGVFVGDSTDSLTTDGAQGDSERNGTGDAPAIDPFLVCGRCHMKTCTRRTCKQLHRHHLGVHAICPGALEDDGVKKLREENGWKRCPRCWVLTEKTKGCDEIRCICRAEWCYTCGKMRKGNDSCVCRAPQVADLVGGNRASEAVEHVDVNRNRSVEEAELPSLAEIFGFEGRSESVAVVESIEAEG